MRFSKWLVAAVIMLNVVFTAAVLYVFLRVGSEPTALVTAWFAFTTGELWLLAGIRKKKLETPESGSEYEGSESNEIG